MKELFSFISLFSVSLVCCSLLTDEQFKKLLEINQQSFTAKKRYQTERLQQQKIAADMKNCIA